LGATDIIGYEAEYYGIEPIPAEETSRSQKNLICAISVNTSIDHSSSRELFELRWPSFRVGYLIAEGVGITDCEDRIAAPVPNVATAV
jgi:hypothetical protein